MTTDERMALAGVTVTAGLVFVFLTCFMLDLMFAPPNRGNTPWAVAVRNGITCTLDAECAAAAAEQPNGRCL